MIGVNDRLFYTHLIIMIVSNANNSGAAFQRLNTRSILTHAINVYLKTCLQLYVGIILYCHDLMVFRQAAWHFFPDEVPITC